MFWSAIEDDDDDDENEPDDEETNDDVAPVPRGVVDESGLLDMINFSGSARANLFAFL